MKNIYVYIVLLFCFLNACQYSDISEQLSPMNDTTKLWPAYDTENNLYGYINRNGEMKIKGQFLSASTFSCGLAKVQLLDHSFGYIDKRGNLLANGFISCGQHHENLAVATTDNIFGYINQKGTWSIVLSYKTTQYTASNFSSDKIALLSPLDTSAFLFIDKTGEPILSLNKNVVDFVDNFHESFTRFRKNSHYGFINRKGEVSIKPKYIFADNFHYGFAVVKTNEYYTFINKEGEEINAVLDNAKRFSDNHLAPICKNKKWGYIDTLGHVKIDFLYDNAYPFSEQTAVVMQNQKYGIIDENGSIIIPFEYDGMQNYFHNDMILAYKIANDIIHFYYLNTDNVPIYEWEEKYNSAITKNTCNSTHF